MTSEGTITQNSSNGSNNGNSNNNNPTSCGVQQEPSSSSSINQQSCTNCCANHTKLQSLKTKKIELEKKLNEKNKILSQILRDENNLIKLATENQGIITPTPSSSSSSTSNSINNKLNQNGSTQNITNLQSLRRKVIGTSFKLPENLLNNHNDDIVKLLLEKKVQQQISEASLKLANDLTQTKSIRRAHKQNYDVAQDKLRTINKSLTIIQQNKLINHEDNINDYDDQFHHSNNISNNNSPSKVIRHNSMKLPSPVTQNHSGKTQNIPHHRLMRHNSDYHHQNPNSCNLNQRQLSPSRHCMTMPSSPNSHNQYHQSGNNYKLKQSNNNHNQLSNAIDDLNASVEQYYTQQYKNQIDNYYRTQNNNYNNEQNQIQQLQYEQNDEINYMTQQQSPQGLGGYWLALENNERIWCSVDTRFSSLDRKNNHAMKMNKTVVGNSMVYQQTKSTSLGNFDFINKNDIAADSVSISSINSENKKPKEKIWSETSLDSPPINNKMKQQSNLSQHSPSNYSTHNYNQSNYYPVPTIQLDHLHGLPSSSGTVGGTYSNISSNHSNISNKIQNPQNEFSNCNINSNHHLNNNPIISGYDNVQIMTKPSNHYKYDNIEINSDNLNNYSSPGNSQNIVIVGSPNQSQSISSGGSNNNNNNENIRIESPKNMTVVQQAKFRPYKEISKPFEMSDFYKYSTKFRQKNNSESMKLNQNENFLNKSEDEVDFPFSHSNNNNNNNSSSHSIQKVYYQPPNPSICQPINYQ